MSTLNVTGAPTLGDLSGTRRARRPDSLFKASTLGAGLLVLMILAGIAISTTRDAWPAFQHEGLSFFTSDNWNTTTNSYGALAIIYGTFVVSAIALLAAVPISLGIALFITEVAPGRVRRAVTTVMDVLASVPSVVFGLWGFLVLKQPIGKFFNSVADLVSGVPILNKLFGPSTGTSFMTAGLIVALMITPIITSLLREVFQTVPINDKNGAMALGATKWEMIRGVVFPHSTGGIVGSVMLGLGRAMGETIAVALVIGASPQIIANLFGQGEAMPSIIARNLGEAQDLHKSALIALGVALFVLTILVNMAARSVVSRVDRRTRGSI